MRSAIVIPARMASTRFPGKPLADLAGKPMVQWVWERAVAADCADRVVIATPDEEIAEVARGFGAEVAMTRMDHPSGTDRIAEVADALRAEFYVNVQGDEPLVPIETIRRLARSMEEQTPMASVW
ncbi:3-deoxy-manno-octulosonate cytidylyltransferase, partial [bacterium]